MNWLRIHFSLVQGKKQFFHKNGQMLGMHLIFCRFSVKTFGNLYLNRKIHFDRVLILKVWCWKNYFDFNEQDLLYADCTTVKFQIPDAQNLEYSEFWKIVFSGLQMADLSHLTWQNFRCPDFFAWNLEGLLNPNCYALNGWILFAGLFNLCQGDNIFASHPGGLGSNPANSIIICQISIYKK